MLLLKVYSNKNTFKTVEFNRHGLNFILACQKEPKSTDKGKTYNGVGKSLLVRIIHFCMGANARGYKSFCENLPGWEFYVDFLIENEVHTVKRTTDNPNKIYLDDEEYTVERFNSRMQRMCFNIPDGISNLTFRSLFPFFIRPNASAYKDYDNPTNFKKDYQKILNNAFLLGLDIFLAQDKAEPKQEKDRIKELENSIKKEDFFRDYFFGDKDVTLTVLDLEEQIKRLDENLKEFKVAEDYEDIQIEADRIERKLFSMNNEIILLQNNIERIDESLEIKASIGKDDVLAIYEEAKVYFSENLTKTLDEIQEFYDTLLARRKKRLLEQKNKLLLEKEKKEVEVEKLQKEFNGLMKYLGDHQALDVFIALSNRSAGLKAQRDNLIKFHNLQQECKEKIRQIERKQLESTEMTEKYLKEMQSEIGELIDYFRRLAKRFYPSSVSGLSVENNDGDNQLRYNIEAKIESDSSDGINNVKIFFYDLTILFKGHMKSLTTCCNISC